MDIILQAYRERFVEMIRENDPEIVDNSSRLHARIIIQELIRHASETVFIQCTNFASDIYGDPETQGILRDALQRGVQVRIAVRNSVPHAEAFANELNDLAHDTVRSGENVFANDCCVVDRKRFRLERDKKERTAYVCAYNPPLAEKLAGYFESPVNVAGA